MSMEHLLVIALVIMPGVWSGNWNVIINKNPCALSGTSVVIQCSYDYPEHHNIIQAQWFKKDFRNNVLRSLHPDRFVFIGDFNHNCSLLIKDIDYSDSGRYYFKFQTDYNKWTSEPSDLSVKLPFLTASVEPSTATEGENVKLTCNSYCSTQTNLQFFWFRDQQPVSKSNFMASREDAGSYHCALAKKWRKPLSSVVLNVHYAPKNVMLSKSASKDVIQGSVVVFSCNSEALPPVTDSGYRLFNDGQFISFGPEHTISEVQPSDSGQYYCQASNNITWRGSSLFMSPTINLNVQYRPMNISITVDSAEVIEGGDVNLTCNSNANPPANEYTWYKRGSSSDPSSMVLMGSGPVLSLSSLELSHTGLYTCQVRNKHGENNSTELLLSVKTKDTSTSLPILAGIGVSLFVALVLAVALYWKKIRKPKNIKMTVICERGSTSSVNDETVDHIYANTFHTPSTQDQTDVIYSVVTIKTKSESHPRQIQTRAPEMNDSVIYTTVTKPR